MGRFTDEQLARMAPGRSPQELADLDMEAGDWERKGAELLAAHAESTHRLAMAKAEGLNAINSVQFDPEILEGARVQHNRDPSGPSVDDIIERVIIPIREKYLAQFDSPAPVSQSRVGEHEAKFNKLTGEK